MAESLPPELNRLLGASDDLSCERAWTEFLNSFSPLILHAARTASSGYDEGMDAYAAALDGLRSDEFRRLRGYSADPRCRFSTWLVVVVRRICIDLQRQRYGRASTKEPGAIADERVARRRLTDLVGASIELDALPDSGDGGAIESLERRERAEVLESALSELEERDRLLLTLRFVDELPARRIAELQSWPDHMAVYRRITQLTTSLRGKLRARGVDTSS